MRVNKSFYKCDSKFHIDDIIDMYKSYDKNGIVYTDGKICIYYELVNRDLRKIYSSDIHLQNQFSNGGQSQNRLARNRDINRDHYISELAEKTVNLYYDKNINKSKISNIVFCGPAEFKIELSKHKLIIQYFENIHLINMADIDYNLLIETVNNFDDPKEKNIISSLNDMIRNADDKLTFGDDIIDSLKLCEIETIYIHEDCKTLDNLTFEYNPTIIILKSHMILDYGGIIGVKFY